MRKASCHGWSPRSKRLLSLLVSVLHPQWSPGPEERHHTTVVLMAGAVRRPCSEEEHSESFLTSPGLGFGAAGSGLITLNKSVNERSVYKRRQIMITLEENDWTNDHVQNS